MLMTLTKHVYTSLTDTERIIITMALEELSAVYKIKYRHYDEMPDYQKLIKKINPKKASKLLDKFRDAPKQDTFETLLKFFKGYREVNNSNINAPYNYNSMRIKLYERQPNVIIDALEKYLKDGDKKDEWMQEKYENKWNRKTEFTVDIWRRDVEELIEGMKEVKNALASRWIQEVDNLP